jgi:HAD superfamily hydrolase (TIGR01490 family)
MQRETFAFFDVDHTISRRATAVAFMLVCMRRGILHWAYLLAAPFLFLVYRLFSFEMDFLYGYSLPKLRGVTRAELEDIGRESFDRYLARRLYPGALREIETLQRRGVRVILATSTPFEAVYPLAQRCGIAASDVVASQFAYAGERFEGKLIGSPVFSKYKSGIIDRFVRADGGDLAHCSFYSDSVHDLPLLELVGHPVAANPDLRLRRIARARGWEIKDFRL